MKNIAVSSPGQKDTEYGYKLAYKLAGEQLAGINDLEQQCLKSGSECRATDSGQVIIVQYLNQSYQVTLPDVNISRRDSEEDVPIKERILILHYLTQAQGTRSTKKLIAYKELPEGIVYFPTFHKRTIKPLLDYFSQAPERLLDVAASLGGYKADYGDTSVTVNAFSRVPITLVLWRGDEECPPEGNILFDSTVSDYLTTEDINVLCEVIAWRLVKLLKAGGDKVDRS